MVYQPLYRPFDLGAYEAALAGETLDLLVNPTRELYRRFAPEEGAAWLADVAFVCGCAVEEIEARFALYDEALFTWLFVPVDSGEHNPDGSVKWLLPHVYAVWDAYTRERVKKLSAPPPSRTGTSGLTPARAHTD